MRTRLPFEIEGRSIVYDNKSISFMEFRDEDADFLVNLANKSYELGYLQAKEEMRENSEMIMDHFGI